MPVSAPVEPMPALFAGGGVDRADATEGGETDLAAQPLWVVSDRGQQRGCDLHTDALTGGEGGGSDAGDERLERGVQVGDLVVQALVAAREAGQGLFRGPDGISQLARPEPGATATRR